MKYGPILFLFYIIIMCVYLFQKYIKFYIYRDLDDFINTDFIGFITILFIKFYLISKIILIIIE